MEEIREEKEEKAENNTSGEGTNVVLVIISACVLIITVTVAAIFLLHPGSKGKNTPTQELAYTKDIRDTDNKDATQAQLENKTQETNDESTVPAENGTDSGSGTPTANPANPANSTNPAKSDDNSTTNPTARQGGNALNFTYGDPDAKPDSTKKLTTTPEIIVEKRYDPKTDLEEQTATQTVTQSVTAPVHKQQGKLQPPVRNRTTAVTDKQELTSKQKTTTEKNASVATVQQPRTISVKEYWIQVASFKSKTRAESLNEKLRQLGYAGTIKTTNIEGETLFRVRLGPYSNNSEAEKFRNWLIGINGLEGSYVSQSTKKKTIN